jgi:hypothetical protein
MRQPNSGPGGNSSSKWTGGSGSGGGSKRNAAVAKFLGQLTEKKDALSNAIKSSPLAKGLEGSQSPAGAASPAGFSRHLASTFGDKAAGFSHRREQQGSAAGGGAEQGLSGLGALAGTGAAGSSDYLPGTVHGGSTVGSTAAAAAAAAPQSSSNGSSNMGRSAAADTGLGIPSMHAAPENDAAGISPAAGAGPPELPVQPPSPSAAHSQVGLQGRADSISISSSSGWAQQEGQQHDLQSTAK